MDMNFAKFPTPALTEEAQDLYVKLYGNVGERFIEILHTSRNEIAVISRLIAYLADKEGAYAHGCTENG